MKPFILLMIITAATITLKAQGRKYFLAQIRL